MKITPLSGRHIRIGRRLDVNQPLARMRNVSDAIGVFIRSVLGIPSGKILDKNCESLYWWQTIRLFSNVYA